MSENRFALTKAKNQVISISLPEPMIKALDRIAASNTMGNRSKVIEIICQTDLEVRAALNAVMEEWTE